MNETAGLSPHGRDRLYGTAEDLAASLLRHRRRVVFAESCTAGLVAATLARFPGISAWLCGSAVVYRENTKHGWLDVSSAALEQYTAVSEVVAWQMATGVLDKTPEADFAVSITGHLGPHAPPEKDGLIFIGLATRMGFASESSQEIEPKVHRIVLSADDRGERQNEAAWSVLTVAKRHLEASASFSDGK